MKLDGFHGTNKSNYSQIIKNGFKPSNGSKEWLGSGVYFFIGDTFCPVENAKNWAITAAWNSQTKQDTYNQYSIIKAEVELEHGYLDLREKKHQIIFDKFRQKYEESTRTLGKIKYDLDTFIFNLIAKELALKMLISDFYIKTKTQRVKRLQSRIPNSTVMCVKDTKNIKNLSEYLTGSF